MRGFEIERTLDEDTCSMETLPEKNSEKSRESHL